jgi:4-carboxymuconolactone decarboxylase
MTRIPVLSRDRMDPDQQVVHDRIIDGNGVIGSGPSVGYAYSAEVWRLHDEASTHLLDCSLTGAQVRIVSLMTVRHWKAAYPWSAQARRALAAGLDPAKIEAINEGLDPHFDDEVDAAVHAATGELLATGTLSDAGFESAEAALGHKRMVEIVHTISHFSETALMANLVGAVPPADAPSHLEV